MYPSLQVFEHQVLRVGDQNNGYTFEARHLKALAQFNEQHHNKYFSLIYNGIKFSHYVGALQVGDLAIEILPKADRYVGGDRRFWQGVLLDMLKSCRLIKVESLSSTWLKLRANSILELYFEIFLNEVELLLRKGLVKSYRRKEGNLDSLKGRLILQKHLSKNGVHREKFYVNHEEFDEIHLANQILLAALLVLKQLLRSPILSAKLKRLLTHFPPIPSIPIYEKHFQKIPRSRKMARYQAALDIARLLILNYSPDIKGGKQHLLALLFDMNLLFEEYVYQQLRRLSSKDLSVKRQQLQPFWNRRYIQPDIVLTFRGKNYILDTKWKVLKKVSPEMKDLKQLFIYCQYFNAKQGLLLYPKVYELENMPATFYEPIPNDANIHHSVDYEELFEEEEVEKMNYACQICFLEIVDKKGQLNKNIGAEILKHIEAT